jgi:hypothetical protein
MVQAMTQHLAPHRLFPRGSLKSRAGHGMQECDKCGCMAPHRYSDLF